ncbi:uncharacterized protein K452DRAFT_260697 [Aplosporella prunicola CBS 121167]|uniref:Heterokaryon incompatibility domain-containing protein n=1 Tax=Aplosporella prunicola CBS 121167 TaxID=1176127 RepID=A0A6A6AWR4_9PEZI|nr:uncharacterized protein K452DRAFT_260697 [Aplosporella prunicola CBS 121167]KAF2135425.1 hypothetical protein K452DRAFT_260697 [Aplosporella prunicola CBS 121167]
MASDMAPESTNLNVDNSEGTFVYEALSTTDRQIRLVEILPGGWHDEISCTLRTVFLDNNPEYETLSYVWGDRKLTKAVCINGHVVKVTENLWIAMRRLRQNVQRTFWIDAICINQNDNQEKSQQVRMMGSIFRLCLECSLWLGEGPDLGDSPPGRFPPISITASRVFELLGMLCQKKHLQEYPCFCIADDGAISEREEYTAHFNALHKLCKSPWWERIWVIQEAVLPKLPNDTPCQDKSSIDTFWRTTILDSVFHKGTSTDDTCFRRALSTDYELFRATWYTIQKSTQRLDNTNHLRNMNAISLTIYYTARGRRMFTTRQGNLGMAPLDAASGDEIHILLGSKWPFLLRPHPIPVFSEEHGANLPTYTVIGECYLHGIMDGEALEGDWETRVQKVALR